jgi:hypothetical protein
MLTWTIENVQEKDYRREVTVNVEGKVTSRDCAGLFTLCLDNHNRCDHLVFDLTRIEEGDGSLSILFCCIRKTADYAAERIFLRGIPHRLNGPAIDFSSIFPGEACEFCSDCHSPVSGLMHGAPSDGNRPAGRSEVEVSEQ